MLSCLLQSLLIHTLCLLGTADPEALALFRQWSRSPSAELRMQAARALRGQRGEDARAALLSLLDDDHAAVRAAVRAEIVRRDPADTPLLAAEIARLRSARARLEGLRALLERGQDPTPFARDPDGGVRSRALATGRVERAALREAMRRRDGPTRGFALESLGDPALARTLLRDRAEEVRIAAARTVDDPGSIDTLLRDRSWRVRLAALGACERIRDPAVLPGLIQALSRASGRLRARAAETLERLTGAPFGEDAARWQRWLESRPPDYALAERPAPESESESESARKRKSQRKRKPKRKEHTSARVTFRRIPVVSRRICFVLDASRSMSKPAPGARGKSRWELVVADLLAVLERLPRSARFNVVLFRTEVDAWKPRLVPATPGARRACREWIEAAHPAGWTNLFDALAVALADDEVDAVYLLTDGVPSRGAETARRAILDEIAYLNHFRLVQINCVQAGGAEGLGKSWRGFLDDLAAAHEGLSVRE